MISRKRTEYSGAISLGTIPKLFNAMGWSREAFATIFVLLNL
jgi:hypothetical protein